MQTNPQATHVNSTGAIRRVLLVDDSRSQLLMMSRRLERWGFEVHQALSGEEALQICADTPPDLVLSDWMMPGMDGLEFCRRFRAMPRDEYGYFILLTSKSEKAEIAEGLGAGADDFLTKPVNGSELRARINAGDRVLMMERQLHDRNRDLSDALEQLRQIHEAIDRDLRQARTIQQSLVPERKCELGRHRISLLLQPCGHVGGDLVGFFTVDDERLGLYSIDVSGHGITSAMVTARVAGHLSNRFPDQNVALERDGPDGFRLREPVDTAVQLNRRFAADPGVAEYLTMAYLAADLAKGEMKMVQAGHPPPLLLRADGDVQFLGDGGLPIGLVEEVSYDQISFSMQDGDRLLMYSDGFTEAVMQNGEMLGEDGLAQMFREANASADGTELLQDLFWRLASGMASGHRLDDDVSAALLEFGVISENPSAG